MWKRLSSSLTLRIFLITTALLLAVSAVTYGAIAYLTPMTYTSMLEDELISQSGALVDRLAETTPDGSGALIEEFIRQTGAEVTLVDAQGNVLYGSAATEGALDTQVVITEGYGFQDGAETQPSAGTSAEDVVEQVVVQDYVDAGAVSASEVISGGMHSFTFADGTEALITVYGGTRAVNLAVEAIDRVLPFLVGVILLISLAGSFFYARFITRPVVGLSKIARRLAALDFSARWEHGRGDEIGTLGDSLNLLSDNLCESLEKLEAANRALRQDIDRERALEKQRMAFFAAASHELKTPVTILKGQLGGMLAQVGIYRDREKYLARALEVTARMEGLIREILTINRIGSGDFLPQLRRVDISALMEEQLELDRELMEQKGLRLETKIEPGVAVRGDSALLSKAIDNVLLNAILYSPEGATVRVRVEGGAFAVENSGASVGEEALGQLFTPFYRVEQSRNRKSGGSGLGLYLVKTILDLHGAACRMENTAEGVRFSASFPDAPGEEK